ncbi:MAG: hypothetical protein AAB380_02465 [Verrucomicrobiota bacterium]
MKAKLEKNHKANIDAIEQHLTTMRKTATAPALSLQSLRSKKPSSEVVEEIITSADYEFRIPDICLRFKAQTGKEPSDNVRRMISGAINKLRQRNPPEIIEVEKGKGSRSGKYRYTKQG